jgi:hypothetical protein
MKLSASLMAVGKWQGRKHVLNFDFAFPNLGLPDGNIILLNSETVVLQCAKMI